MVGSRRYDSKEHDGGWVLVKFLMIWSKNRLKVAVAYDSQRLVAIGHWFGCMAKGKCGSGANQ